MVKRFVSALALFVLFVAAGPVQWKAGERVSPFTAIELDNFIRDWKAEVDFRGMSEKEQERAGQQYEARMQQMQAKKDQREACMQNIPPADMVAIQASMQDRMIKLATSGDPNAAQKASEEMQKAMMALIEKKCGPEIKEEPADPRSSPANFRMKEWVMAYLAVRQEKGAPAAGKLVLATDAEAKLIEARLDALQKLSATEDKLAKAGH